MKDIPGFEGLYAVTEDGRVWSYPKVNGFKMTKGQWMKGKCEEYMRIGLRKNKKDKTMQIHRIVAITYKPNPNNYKIVRHLDNNKYNNHVSNLEWCTHEINIRQSYDDGLRPISQKVRDAIKKNQKKSVLSTSRKVMQLTKEGILCKIYKSASEACRDTGVCLSSISQSANGKMKHAGGYSWKYINLSAI